MDWVYSSASPSSAIPLLMMKYKCVCVCVFKTYNWNSSQEFYKKGPEVVKNPLKTGKQTKSDWRKKAEIKYPDKMTPKVDRSAKSSPCCKKGIVRIKKMLLGKEGWKLSCSKAGEWRGENK